MISALVDLAAANPLGATVILIGAFLFVAILLEALDNRNHGL